MTHFHMHYKACEMHPILNPVMVQNNADYCQINSQTSFNENSMLFPYSQSEMGWGGVWDMYTRSGVTSFNSCHNPELETVSPLCSHWIRPDLKGCTATFSKGSLSHAAFQLPILHGLSEFIPFSSQKHSLPLQQTDSL